MKIEEQKGNRLQKVYIFNLYAKDKQTNHSTIGQIKI